MNIHAPRRSALAPHTKEMIDAERVILALQLQNAPGAVKTAQERLGRPLSLPLHRAIQEAIASLASKNHPIGSGPVLAMLRPRREFESVNLHDYLIELASLNWRTEAQANKMMHEALAKWDAAHAATRRRPLFDDVPRSLRRAVALTRSDIMTPTTIDWLWPGWIACGKLHLIAGAPGTGKTTIALSLAAALSRGSAFADGSPAPQRSTIIWSGEDDILDTLLPRFIASGGERERLFAIDHVREGGGEKSAFDPARDLRALARGASELADLGLVIIDPIVAALRGDGHGNAGTRRALRPLVDLAEATGAAILGITHFTKRSAGREPWERVIGSTAFTAAARGVWATVNSDDGSEAPFRLVRAKSNYGPARDGFRYALVQKPSGAGTAQTIEWHEPVFGSARELLGRVETGDRASLLTAERWLQQRLSAGPVSVSAITNAAKADGLTLRTLGRAKASLGVRSFRVGGVGEEGAWQWQLPQGRD